MRMRDENIIWYSIYQISYLLKIKASTYLNCDEERLKLK